MLSFCSVYHKKLDFEPIDVLNCVNITFVYIFGVEMNQWRLTMSNKSVHDTSCIEQFTNCYLLKDHSIVKEDLLVRNGTILNPEKVFYVEKDYADIKTDCNGSLISPGFIDVQINGKNFIFAYLLWKFRSSCILL